MVLSFLIISCSADDLPSITVDTLQSKLQSDTSLVLLDIRTEGEFNGPLGRLDGAILIPLGNLENRIAELEEFKDKEIIVLITLKKLMLRLSISVRSSLTPIALSKSGWISLKSISPVVVLTRMSFSTLSG